MWYLTFSRPARARAQITPHLQEHLDWQRRMHTTAGALLRAPATADGHHPRSQPDR